MRAIIFSLTLLLSSFLLFLVQPMIGRMLLPSLGGTPAVWNVCVLFFQIALLGGYAWAHYGPPKLGVRNHLLTHLVLLGIVCLLLPMQLLESWPVPTTGNPLPWLMGQLAFCVGIPFFAISSSAPLLQRWFSISSNNESEGEPWFLYAVSNVGSLGALLGYPFLVERAMGLETQRWFWMGGFLLLAAMFSLCAWLTLRGDRGQLVQRGTNSTKSNNQSLGKPLPWAKRFQYILLAAIPSSLMLGVTTVVSTEVGSFPLMWSIPLALYLLTFVIVFANRVVVPHRWILIAMPIAVLALPMLVKAFGSNGSLPMLTIHFTTFFLVALACHGEMARLKPDVSQLTEFFLMMSIGGVIGGAVNSLVAPVVFDSILEYPLMLAAACFVLPSSLGRNNKTQKQFAPIKKKKAAAESQNNGELYQAPDFRKSWVMFGPFAVALAVTIVGAAAKHFGLVGTLTGFMLVFGIPSLICLTLLKSPKPFAIGVAVIAMLAPMLLRSNDVLCKQRGFFGVNEVYVSHGYRMLRNGTTLHGMQKDDSNESPEALTYYHADGPIGDVFRLYGSSKQSVAAVGLGVGSLAAYSKPGQTFDFYEIDPVVLEIADNPRLFNYLSSAKGDVKIVLGDARIQLERLRKNQDASNNVSALTKVVFPAPREKTKSGKPYELMILDAFGSDAVPLHLLTAEAMELYFDLLPEDGLLVLHISSKYLNFVPVAKAFTEKLNVCAALRRDQVSGKESAETGRFGCSWVVFSGSEALINEFVDADSGWKALKSEKQLLWTDDHANIIDAIDW